MLRQLFLQAFLVLLLQAGLVLSGLSCKSLHLVQHHLLELGSGYLLFRPFGCSLSFLFLSFGPPARFFFPALRFVGLLYGAKLPFVGFLLGLRLGAYLLGYYPLDVDHGAR